MPVQHARNPSQVRLVENRLDTGNELAVRVETADLGADNQASLHVWDERGHITDIPLAPATPGATTAFVGKVSIDDLKQRGFDPASLHEQAFTTFKNAQMVYWGDPQQYDAKRYREQVGADPVWRGSSINDAADFADLIAATHPKTIVCLRERREAKFNADEALADAWNRQNPSEAVDVVRMGMGRTGTMMAVYRMAISKWPLDRAIDEAKKHGLGDAAQIAFLTSFAARLAAGAFPGLPRP